MDSSVQTTTHRANRRGGFALHLLEMTVVMIVSMIAGGAIFLTPQGLTVDQALVRYPVLFPLVIAVSMAIVMVAWMRFRGHSWRSCSEMAACMVLPLVPFVVLFWLGVIAGQFCGLFCFASFAAMIGLMAFRRDEYGMDHTAHQHA